MTQGKLIVIEGGDGAGKNTQADMLVHRLVQEGYQIGTLGFPRYMHNVFGELLRECLDGKYGNFLELHPRIASVIFAADRYESKKQLDEWLSEGRVVVLDRYVSSNMLHQGAKIEDAEELNKFIQWLDKVEYEVFKLPRPDLILYLDVDPEERMKLLQHAVDKRENVIDLPESNLEHQQKTSACATKIIDIFNNWKHVHCMQSEDVRTREEIHEEVYALVKEII